MGVCAPSSGRVMTRLLRAGEAVAGYRCIVVRQVRRELVMPVVGGHEVEIAHAGGTHRGLNGGAAGAGDGSGWESLPAIRVVGRVGLEIFAGEALAILPDRVLY